MLKKLIYLLVRRRHYWRDADFSELGELYVSTVLRGLAINLFGIFIPIYMYKLGYSLTTIMWFFVIFFAVRIIADVLSGYWVARYGPKHGMALSVVLQIAYLVLILTLKDLNWPLVVVAVFGALATSFYFISFHVDLSKIKHSRHGGKEIGFVNIFERVGGVLGPLVGGLLATFFDARYAVAVAIIVLLLSLAPFFFTAEPVATRQHIKFKGMDWKPQIRNYISLSGLHLENNASVLLWPLLVGVSVFTTNTYAKLGALISLSTALTLVVIHVIGVQIDKHQGRQLLRWAVLINAGIHFSRPFMLSNVGAIIVSASNDPVTVAYRIPMSKGWYDAADSLPGYRIAYIVSGELVGSVTKCLLWVMLLVLAEITQPIEAMQWIYLFVGAYSLLILAERFLALNAKERH